LRHFANSFFVDSKGVVSKIDDLFQDKFVNLFGKIYNYYDLKSDFGLGNDIYNINHLIYWGFKKKGASFFTELNGDFVIFLFDRIENEYYIVRDHLGLIPFGFILIENKIYLSDSPLVLSKFFPKNERSISNFVINNFLWQTHDYSLLPNENVRQIPPGHYVKIGSNGKVSTIKYWFPEKIKVDRSLKQEVVVNELSQLLFDAVKIRTDENVETAAHVSGGLDSGIVAAIARKNFPKQKYFYGFSWSPNTPNHKEDVSFDEKNLVKSICEKNKIIPYFIDYNEKDNLKQIANWESPSEMIFENQVMSIAKEKGIKVIFSGWGGDEFISIGNRGIDADLVRKFHWKSFLRKYPIAKPKNLLSALFFNALFPSIKMGFSKYKIDPSIYPYLKNVVSSNIIPPKESFSYSSRRKVHLQLLHLGHLSKRVNDWYLEGLKHGISYRFPLLDKRIVEYMLKVPSNCLVGENNCRILLRIIGKDLLPNAVIKNKSKDDPVKSYHLDKIFFKTREVLLEDYEEYKKCKYFNFVDFDLIDKDIKVYHQTKDEVIGQKLGYVLSLLKSNHEFLKDFLKQNPSTLKL
jgi:asparagine synthase (glutamine-hydrolysing)